MKLLVFFFNLRKLRIKIPIELSCTLVHGLTSGDGASLMESRLGQWTDQMKDLRAVDHLSELFIFSLKLILNFFIKLKYLNFIA